jgi:hypothetical protein
MSAPNATAGGRALAATEGKAKAGRNGKAGAISAAEAAGESRKAVAAGKAAKPRVQPAVQAVETKTSIEVKKLRSQKGVTIDILMEVTGWQAPFGARLPLGGGQEEARTQSRQ